MKNGSFEVLVLIHPFHSFLRASKLKGRKVVVHEIVYEYTYFSAEIR